jgi:hypothetical protein
MQPNIIKKYFFYYFSNGLRLSPLGTVTTVWPTVPAPDDMMSVEQSVECELAGENLPQCHFVHHKFHMT